MRNARDARKKERNEACLQPDRVAARLTRDQCDFACKTYMVADVAIVAMKRADSNVLFERILAVVSLD